MQTGDKFKVDYQLARVILMSAQIPLSGGLGWINGEIYIWEHFIRRFRSSKIELKTFYTDFMVRPEAVCDWWRHLEKYVKLITSIFVEMHIKRLCNPLNRELYPLILKAPLMKKTTR